jgi:hypothetical protein
MQRLKVTENNGSSLAPLSQLWEVHHARQTVKITTPGFPVVEINELIEPPFRDRNLTCFRVPFRDRSRVKLVGVNRITIDGVPMEAGVRSAPDGLCDFDLRLDLLVNSSKVVIDQQEQLEMIEFCRSFGSVKND